MLSRFLREKLVYEFFKKLFQRLISYTLSHLKNIDNKLYLISK